MPDRRAIDMNRQLRRTQAMRRLDIIAERRAQARERRLHEPPLPDHVDPFIDQPVVNLAAPPPDDDFELGD